MAGAGCEDRLGPARTPPLRPVQGQTLFSSWTRQTNFHAHGKTEESKQTWDGWRGVRSRCAELGRASAGPQGPGKAAALLISVVPSEMLRHPTATGRQAHGQQRATENVGTRAAALPGLGLEVGAGGPSAPLATHTRQFSLFLKDGSATW